MPKVPLYDSPQVREQPTPTPRIVNPLGVQEATVAGKQISAMGDAAGRTSGQAFDLALKAQQEANTLRAEDAANQWLETANNLTENKDGTGWRDQKGLAAFQRPDGKSLADEFSEKLDRRAAEVSGALANDEQRRLFASRVDQTRTQLRGQIGAHEGNEFNTYTVSVRETSISQAMKSVALNYTNPELVAQGVDTIRASARDLARLAGKPAEWAEAQAKEAVSKAHGAALGAMFAKQDFTAAEAYLKLYKDQMEPEQLTTASLQITAQGEARVALDAVNGTEGEAWRDVNPGSMDSLLSLTGAAESRNRDFNTDGSPVVSPAGARYRMQVMPATARDPGFGIRPAADDSPAEYNRVGRELLGKLIGKYDGDVRKALAAYNWGSGNVDKIVAQAAKDGVDWFSKLPTGRRTRGQYSPFNDVQGYVNKIHGAWVSGGGRASQMTGTDFVDSAVSRARAASGGELSASAELKVRQLAGARWNDIQSTKREQTADATNQVLALSQSGMSLPEIQGTALGLGLPADSKATITDYVSGRQSKDQYGNYLLYSDPEQLSQFKSEGELRALRPLLGDQLTGQLINTWRSAGKPEAATIDAEDLNQVAAALGLDPYKKSASAEDREKLGRVKFGIEQAIAAEQGKLRRPLTREEKLAVAQREAARTVQVQGWFGKPEDTSALLVDPERVQGVVVPQGERSAVVAALQRLYAQTGDERYNPSNENNVRRFWVAGQTTAGGMTY